MMTKLLRSPLFFLLLLLVYPVTFFMSANPSQYTVHEFGFLISLIIGASLILSLIIELSYRIFNIRLQKRYVYLGAAILLAFLPLHRVTRLLPPSFIQFSIIYVILSVIAFRVAKNNMKCLNIFLLLVNAVNLGQYMYLDKKDEKWMKSIPWQYSSLKLKTKPNIYYFYMESHQGQEGLKDVFNFDNSEFYSFLNNKNFTIYDNTYSNYCYTIASLLSTFMMGHHFCKIEIGNLDARREVFGLLSGDKNNIVIDILRNNGYEINYYMGDKYLVRGECHADHYDLPYNPFGALQILGFKLDKNLFPKGNFSHVDKFTHMLKDSFSRKKPQFFFVKFGGGIMSAVNHINPLLSTKERLNSLDQYCPAYVDNIQKANSTMENIIELIIKNDPSSIIILLGDHGADCYATPGDAKEVKKAFAEHRLKTLANSFFNVICAIRFPDNAIKPEKRRLSNVNIFRYIFSYLSGTDIPFTDNISIAAGLVLLKDAKTISPIGIKEFTAK